MGRLASSSDSLCAGRHPPKRHAIGLTEFAREVGSVVLGVLIALGIGEVAEAARWSVRVDSSMGAMRAELGGNGYNVVERRAYQVCLERRLAEIGQVLGEARRTGILPDVSDVGRPGIRLSESAAFEVAKSEGVSLHMSRKQAREVANAYASFDAYRTLAAEEQNSWRPLRLLEGAPGPVSDSLLTALLQAWADATEQNKLMGIIAKQQDEKLQRLGFAVEYDPLEPDRSALFKSVRSRKICAPLVVDRKPLRLILTARS